MAEEVWRQWWWLMVRHYQPAGHLREVTIAISSLHFFFGIDCNSGMLVATFSSSPLASWCARSGSLVDKFKNRGGNGGGGYNLNCGSGMKITGYRTRCGSLVDRVQFQCRNY